MNQELTRAGTGAATAVVSAEQGKLIDRAKVYLGAEIQSERHRWMFLFLTGACLHQLKAGCAHGQFEQLKLEHFPNEHGSRLTRAMQFSEAVQYLAKGKLPTIGNLAEGEKLLQAGELSEAEKAELVEAVSQATKDRGVMETINEYRKKKNPPHKSTPEDRAADQKRAADDFAKMVLGALNQAQSESGLELLMEAPDAVVTLIEDARIELGHKLKPVLAGRRKAKK